MHLVVFSTNSTAIVERFDLMVPRLRRTASAPGWQRRQRRLTLAPTVGADVAEEPRRTDHVLHTTRGLTMTTFAPHRETLEAFKDCVNGGADK